ncbi:cytoplasmic tRNA 2-thiolation protein 1 [Protomyces lactucae-debilis]|uniref:Cytoplasmic tRNA 2-thiolation protein 1 n=1 Tax=Protomyces lactucae-debilis TaxID=2754530 RepID=A0A1Y2F0I1_PROLT|nr:cytoplasmic tRNA 2-thiolation protein 1 [Protomyces lactucae-debilis]ORY77343.1 cytoplasmic tRNA 2-thiolation protein 1 [Protomyces lactucae-debilis]
MVARQCELCQVRKPQMRRPRNGMKLCKDCFCTSLEHESYKTIVKHKLFHRGERIAIGSSGGKDSVFAAYMLKTLNERYDLGLDLVMLSVDEGIKGYRDDSLETVKRNQIEYALPLKIVSYDELYGWDMDRIVAAVGKKSNCTFCGVFRRQALDRGAEMLGIQHIVTGHNADDMAETVMMNLLRGDVARLGRCTAIITEGGESTIKRSKPFKYTYEKEIVLYAHFKKLDYFSTECLYSPEAFRGTARTLIKDLEAIRPSAIIDIIHSGEQFEIKEAAAIQKPGSCVRCGYMSSKEVCKACVLLEGLNTGISKLGIGDEKKARRRHAEQQQQQEKTKSTTIERRTAIQGGLDF